MLPDGTTSTAEDIHYSFIWGSKMIMNGEWIGIKVEAIMTFFKVRVLVRNSSREAEKDHDEDVMITGNSHRNWPISLPNVNLELGGMVSVHKLHLGSIIFVHECTKAGRMMVYNRVSLWPVPQKPLKINNVSRHILASSARLLQCLLLAWYFMLMRGDNVNVSANIPFLSIFLTWNPDSDNGIKYKNTYLWE
jgi:hypothetical protein